MCVGHRDLPFFIIISLLLLLVLPMFYFMKFVSMVKVALARSLTYFISWGTCSQDSD